MNTIEELDDFELAIRDKLANYEVTPPEGSWNAIVNSQSTVKRNIRIVWFNKSSFFIVFISTMFSMWLAFGSIIFELNNYSDYQSELLKSINRSKETFETINDKEVNQQENQNGNEGSTLISSTLVDASSIDNTTIVDKEPVISEEDNNEYLEKLSSIKTENIQTLGIKEFSLSAAEEIRMKPIGFNKFNLSLKAGQLGVLNKVNDTKLIQSTQHIGIEFDYSLSKKLLLSTGLNYHRTHLSNHTIKTTENNYSVTDTIIVGYIQDPLLGKIPVVELQQRDVHEIQKTKLRLSNTLNGIHIPVCLTYNVYDKHKFNLNVKAGVSYNKLFTSKYFYFDEGETENHINNFSTKFVLSTIGLEARYKLNNRTDIYFNSGYSRNLSNTKNTLAVGAGLELGFGLKYKIW